MTATWLGGAVAVGTGGVLGPVLTRCGLHQVRTRVDRGSRLVAVAAGTLAAGAAVSVWDRTGTWQLLPAVLVWGCALVAAGIGDGMTQRVPTGLVRLAVVAVVVLLIVGVALGGGWRPLWLGVVASGAAGLTMLVCWRYFGVGFGDVRLAALGGLGLVSPTFRGLVVGLVILVVVLGCQVASLAAKGQKGSPVPLGPALAAGFLAASAF